MAGMNYLTGGNAETVDGASMVATEDMCGL